MNTLLVTDRRYSFVPPSTARFWPRILARVMPWVLRRTHQICSIEVRGAQVIAELQKAGHGILLTPNHSRMSDALVLQALSDKLAMPFYVMASAHLFRGHWFQRWILRRLGAFSIYREGIDRQALQKGIEILVEADRPLVIFPEGALSHSNDSLNALQEGVSFVARSAAAKCQRLEKSGQETSHEVFTVPVVIRYVFMGDIEATADRILTSIERRLSWEPLTGQNLIQRVQRVGSALLSLKEHEYLGEAKSGPLHIRLQRLIDHLLVPAEAEWLAGKKQASVIARVRDLRRVILPDMIDGQLPPQELERRWKQLKLAEIAQSLSLYPPDYIASNPTAERILETVERFHEHLSGEELINGPLKAIIAVGQPIRVSPGRDRAAAADSLLCGVESSLIQLLNQTSDECHPYPSAQLNSQTVS